MEDYEPKPIDTSGVVLTETEKKLVELLSANCHDHWALMRMKEGVLYGPVKTDRTHPNLKPYEDLTSEEKDYDRVNVVETLKAMKLLGKLVRKKISELTWREWRQLRVSSSEAQAMYDFDPHHISETDKTVCDNFINNEKAIVSILGDVGLGPQNEKFWKGSNSISFYEVSPSILLDTDLGYAANNSTLVRIIETWINSVNISNVTVCYEDRYRYPIVHQYPWFNIWAVLTGIYSLIKGMEPVNDGLGIKLRFIEKDDGILIRISYDFNPINNHNIRLITAYNPNWPYSENPKIEGKLNPGMKSFLGNLAIAGALWVVRIAADDMDNKAKFLIVNNADNTFDEFADSQSTSGYFKRYPELDDQKCPDIDPDIFRIYIPLEKYSSAFGRVGIESFRVAAPGSISSDIIKSTCETYGLMRRI